VVSFAK